MPNVMTNTEVVERVPGSQRVFDDSLSNFVLEEVEDCYGLSPYAGARMAVSSLLSEEVLRNGRAFINVPETHPFLAEYTPRLYESVRRSAGFSYSDDELLTDVCDPGELEYVKCLIGAALAMNLDGAVFDEALSLVVVFSHDEWIAILEGSPNFRQQLSRLLMAQGSRKLNKKDRRMLCGSEQ